MIVSMKPPYDLNSKILKLITSISESIGEVNASLLNKPSPQLRKQNKIKTIHSSLKIEGNTLTEDQITAILDNKTVIGPQEDITEVKNAINVYENLKRFDSSSEKSFLLAHKSLMTGLIKDPGKFRTQGVGIVKGAEVEHLAPSYDNVPFLMRDLFEFLPFETLISQKQQDYYKALSDSDKEGKSTKFIEYMLSVIDTSLAELLNFKNRTLTQVDRLEYFVALDKNVFSRKDYMLVLKDISSATASRDLAKGIELKLFEKEGEKVKTIYQLIRK